MKRLWSQQEKEMLQNLWTIPGMSAADIAMRLHRPLRAVYMKAHKMRLPRKSDPKTVLLSPHQKLWLKLNFPHMRTQICADHLGISLRSCIRQARNLGLEKTPQFMKECQAVTARLAKESHLRNGTYPPKGVVNENIAKGAPFRFTPKTEKK